MSKKNLRIQDYIEHIIEAIIRIEGYVKGYDADVFIEVNIVQDSVIRNIEIIGEAASNIKSVDSSFLEKYPQLKLEQVHRMRNALAHGYYSVNLRTVWNTVKNDLPVLKQQMLDIQRGMHDI